MSRKHPKKGGTSALDLFGSMGIALGASAPRAPRPRPACATADRTQLVASAGNPVRLFVGKMPPRDGRELPSYDRLSIAMVGVSPGDAAKAAGIARVAENCQGWIDQGLETIRTMAYGERTAEGVLAIVKAKIGEPGHHNACGALISKARRAGYLVDTGRMEKAKSPEKHSRRIPVYRCGVNR